MTWTFWHVLGNSDGKRLTWGCRLARVPGSRLHFARACHVCLAGGGVQVRVCVGRGGCGWSDLRKSRDAVPSLIGSWFQTRLRHMDLVDLVSGRLGGLVPSKLCVGLCWPNNSACLCGPSMSLAGCQARLNPRGPELCIWVPLVLSREHRKFNLIRKPCLKTWYVHTYAMWRTFDLRMPQAWGWSRGCESDAAVCEYQSRSLPSAPKGRGRMGRC